ncbi:SDR family NAD(P)-dependent oxidoreductase [Methylobacterium oryzae CBMB20]
MSARNEGKVRDLAEQLKAKGHKVDVRTVDAADPASVAKLVEGVERDFGGIDVLHFNAASMRNQTLADQPRDSFNTDLAVNIGGAAVAAQAAAPKMLQRGSGSVLFTGGGFGLQPHPEYLSLSIGKAGIRGPGAGHLRAVQGEGRTRRHRDGRGLRHHRR